MSRCTALFLLALLVSTFSSIAGAQELRHEIMHPRELRPGDRGYGLTVFQGVEPVRFEVEILGVLGNRFAGGDMILFRAEPRPEFEGHGVIAGMSGSPVFVNGKLIGAVAYGWGFSLRPIGGITPITDMLEVLDWITVEPVLPPEEMPNFFHENDVPAAPSSMQEFGTLLRSLRGGIPRVEPVSFAADKLRALGVDGIGEGESVVTFQPLSTPLAITTQNPRVIQLAEAFFEGTALRPVMSPLAAAAPGSGRIGHLTDEEYENLKVEDGGALSVVLVDGDLQLAGTGTTTYVEGDRVIGFGHPFFGLGPMDAPAYVSEIASVIPSVIRPFKIGNAVKEIGALRQDRLAAIGVTTSARSAMIPMSLRIDAEDTGIDRTFNFRLWNNRDYIPFLTMTCFMEAMEKATRLDGAMTMETTYRVRLRDGREMRRANYSSRESFAAMGPMFDILMDLTVLMNNRFEAIDLERIDVEVKVRPRQQAMRLERFERGPMELRRGETFRATVRYTQWRQEAVEVPIEVKLPENLRPGTYDVVVADGMNRLMIESALRPELRRVENLNDLLRTARPVFPSDAIHVLLIDPTPGHVVDGRMLENLPTSIARATEATVRRSGQAYLGGARLVSETTQRFPAQVSGMTVFSIVVKDR